MRAGWRGQPLVVLGRREDLPLNLQPLATTVSKPVKHTRLVAGLVKAAAFSRSRQQAPLHSDPSMLTLLPERMGLNRLTTSRRMSLDNSVLDRRRWEAAAAAAAASSSAGDGSSPEAVRSSAPLLVDRSALFAGGSPGGGGADAPRAPAPASGRSSSEGLGGAGGWQPQLAAIMSDDSGGESSRSSMDGRRSMDVPGGSAAPPLAPIAEAPGSPFAALGVQARPPSSSSDEAAPAPAAPPPAQAPAQQAAPAGRQLSILVAEDNAINQLVIRKVLQVGCWGC